MPDSEVEGAHYYNGQRIVVYVSYVVRIKEPCLGDFAACGSRCEQYSRMNKLRGYIMQRAHRSACSCAEGFCKTYIDVVGS
jgi:hypothetical protein